MFGKVFIVFLSSIALTEAGTGMCPDSTGAATVPCVQVQGCNNATDGTLLPIATQCTNQMADSDCQQLFPCSSTTTAPCNQPGTPAGTAGDPTTYPYVRAPACTNPDLQSTALQCAKTCGLCCQSPSYNCADDPNAPINCTVNSNKCKDANWTNIMAQYCPNTCGLCTNGTCSDAISGCNTMVQLCQNVDWQSYMAANCARTCQTCNTTSSSSTSSCADIASNCATNSNLCSNATYQTLMLQQCCATCKSVGITSASSSSSSSSCVDSNSSCSSWVSNGFCSSSFYTTAQKQQYCASSCNLC